MNKRMVLIGCLLLAGAVARCEAGEKAIAQGATVDEFSVTCVRVSIVTVEDASVTELPWPSVRTKRNS